MRVEGGVGEVALSGAVLAEADVLGPAVGRDSGLREEKGKLEGKDGKAK